MSSQLLCAFKKGATEYNIASDCYEQGYQQGRADERPKAFGKGFDSGYQKSRADERDRIVRELEEYCGNQKYLVSEGIWEIVRGGENE